VIGCCSQAEQKRTGSEAKENDKDCWKDIKIDGGDSEDMCYVYNIERGNE